ncbi:MAG: zinc ribbon domain-containing protein [Pontiellaceae bacterium]|nr:zinc ribbon domain-containing protein [Pontiellaceae bacterium]MBN2786309.1 zinc ribbon domain-containing protein [Pontiellaceae bacterium]
MYCSKCGKEISDGSRFCPECGVGLGSDTQTASAQQNINAGTRDLAGSADLICPKNPPTSPHMALLAFVQAGLPHIVFGQVAKGIVIIVAFWMSVPTGFGPLLILVAALIDAYKVGNALKAGRPVKKWEFFPQS